MSSIGTMGIERIRLIGRRIHDWLCPLEAAWRDGRVVLSASCPIRLGKNVTEQEMRASLNEWLGRNGS